MKQIKISFQSIVIAGLTLPTSASAGVLTPLEQQCQCLIEKATLGQLISLGIMLTLVMGIFAMKLMQRREQELPELPDQNSTKNDSAIHALRQLKIGSRFTDLKVGRLQETGKPLQTISH